MSKNGQILVGSWDEAVRIVCDEMSNVFNRQLRGMPPEPESEDDVDESQPIYIRMNFEQPKGWRFKAYPLNVWPKDHLIDNKKHFHLENKQDGIECRFDFDGNHLDCKSDKGCIPKDIKKELKKFLDSVGREVLELLWNKHNPSIQPK